MLFSRIVEKIYKKSMSRIDDKGISHYFDYTDFPGLIREVYPFFAEDGHRLQGYFFYFGEKRYDRIVIFDHGMGAGHRSYMKEIFYLANAGFTVFSYDHTGTRDSEGEGIRGLSQSLCDLDLAIRTLKADKEYQNSSLSVVGHSWGGYSTLNISHFHPDITHRVALSGFTSVSAMLDQILTGFLKKYKPQILALERETNPLYADCDILKEENPGRLLVIHSEDDPVCSYKAHFLPMKEAFADTDSVSFLSLEGRKHNPNYTESAVILFGEYQLRLKKEKRRLRKEEGRKAFKSSFDWKKMTEQDEALWAKIIQFLNT